MKKKWMSVCLILCLVMATACSKAPAASEGDSAQGVLPLKTGILARSAVSEEESEKAIGEHTMSHVKGDMTFELTFYDNMSSMLMALQAKDIYVMILEEFVENRSVYLELGDVVHNRLEELVKEAGLSILGIEHRIKTVKSLAGKLERKRDDYYRKLEDLTDLVGARIICFFADEVDVLGQLVEKSFQIDREDSLI